jgi:hypothetical protein
MSLGDFTKQLAQQAISSSTKDVLDALRPPDLSKISESLGTAKPAPPAAGDSTGAVILGQIQAMQKALKEDEELVVLCGANSEMLRVLEIFVPSWSVCVLTGIDTERVVTRIVAPFETLQLVCKVMKSAKPARVRVVTPRAKPE